MIDNLFIAESPLQAMVAVELSLQLEDDVNGIIYRLSGKGRERNDQQIVKVIKEGNWSFQESIQFAETSALARQLKIREYVVKLKKRFRNQVRTLFFGEFRSQWMHLARFAIAPDKFVLMDDGAATLIAKHRYIDHGNYYPRKLWASTNVLKHAVKEIIFCGLSEERQIRKPVSFASAFLGSESEFNIDFSKVREKFDCQLTRSDRGGSKAYFFGSKYSEAGIISQDYEIEFISNVVAYYKAKGLALMYCAHRDESDEKLGIVRDIAGTEVVRPDLPAELFLLECATNVSEIGAAYSSVINNLSLIFKDKPITSFRLNLKAINPKHRSAIEHVYRHFEKKGIPVLSPSI